MSGGEQRMVSLAMALMRKPTLLLLDEPSLGLSPAMAEQMMTRVRELSGQPRASRCCSSNKIFQPRPERRSPAFTYSALGVIILTENGTSTRRARS